MILGMTTSTFTLVHVLLSLVGIAAGLVVVAGVAHRDTVRRLDCNLSGDDGDDEPNRLHVPVRSPFAVP